MMRWSTNRSLRLLQVARIDTVWNTSSSLRPMTILGWGSRISSNRPDYQQSLHKPPFKLVQTSMASATSSRCSLNSSTTVVRTPRRRTRAMGASILITRSLTGSVRTSTKRRMVLRVSHWRPAVGRLRAPLRRMKRMRLPVTWSRKR